MTPATAANNPLQNAWWKFGVFLCLAAYFHSWGGFYQRENATYLY